MGNDNLTPDGVLLKSRFDKLVEICGGVKRAEMLTRVGQRALYEYGSPARFDMFAPVDVVGDLEKACGQYLVTEGLALIAGGYFVKPARNGRMASAFGSVMPYVGRGVGDLMKDAFAAAEDGKFTPDEIEKLRGDIQTTMSFLALALGVLDGAAQ